MKAICALLITFAIAVGGPRAARAQTGTTHSSRPAFETGRVEGSVYDSESREALIGGMVLIEGTNLGNVTGNDGSYFVDHVPAGTYTISAEYLGYGTIRRTLDVSPGQTVTLDFALPSEVVLANAITAVIEKEPIPVAEPVKEYSVTSEVQVNVPDALPEESCRAMVTVHGSYIVNGQWQLAASVGRLVCGNQEVVCQPIVVYKDPELNQAQMRNGQAAAEAAEPAPTGDPGTAALR
ncbi:MAG TPA: carboxypeptidase-like regulatory domain-containing protein [Gemmatimonadota bacterium]|nr:carboxypeptidase-like regulatory domain-containing protein [Gemmatimonadota bacterium]